MNKFLSSMSILAALGLAFVMHPSEAHSRNYIVNYGKILPNGKTCRVLLGGITHWHVGNSADVSKARAKAKAIQGWSSFVIFEYGRVWRRWSAADKKSMRCEKDNDAGVWRCRTEAQPCKG